MGNNLEEGLSPAEDWGGGGIHNRALTMAKRSTQAGPKSGAAAQPPAMPRPLTDTERAELAAYAQRRRTRQRPPRFESNSASDRLADAEVLSPPAGANVDLFRARLANVVGTIDELAIGQLLSQAAYAVEGKDAVQQCNSAAALLAGIAPRNEIEGMLGVQMLAAHNLGMAMAGRALRTDRLDCLQRYGALSAKLMNVFTRQLEALARLRGQAGKQVVRVEHVTVEAGGQAVVGAVTTGGAGG